MSTNDPFAGLTTGEATDVVDNIDFEGGATAPLPPAVPAVAPNGGAGMEAMTGEDVEVDINDLSKWNHVEDIDPDAMTTDAVPPPPDGVHVMRLKIVKDGVTEANAKKRVKGFDDNSVQFFYYNGNSANPRAPIPANLQLMLVIDVQVDEEGKPGNGQSERKWISTMIDRDRKTSEADTFLRVLTGSAGVGLSNLEKIKKLHDLVKVQEPKIKALTRWAARMVDPVKIIRKSGVEKEEWPYAVIASKDEFGHERKVRAIGMKNFPVARNSRGEEIGHKPVTEDEKGVECRTRFETVAYYPLSYNS